MWQFMWHRNRTSRTRASKRISIQLIFISKRLKCSTVSSSCFVYSLNVFICCIFRPNKFILTMFANELSTRGKDSQQEFLWDRDEVLLVGYRRTNLQFVRLAHDTLVYAQYRRCGTLWTINVGAKFEIISFFKCQRQLIFSF